MSTPLDSASQPNLHLHLGRNYGMRPFTRHITGHDAAGKSKFLPSPHVLYLDRGGYEITRSFAVGSVPAQLTDDQDVRSYLSSDGKTEACSYANAGAQILVPNGLNFLTVDFGPSSSTAMHRTVTIDFVTVVQGQLVLELDGGEKKLLKAGVSSHRPNPFIVQVSCPQLIPTGHDCTTGNYA